MSIEENDGLILLPMLTKCKSRKDIESLLDTKVQGPWGLIYWQVREWSFTSFEINFELQRHLPSVCGLGGTK